MSFLYFLKRIVFVKRHVWFFRIYLERRKELYCEGFLFFDLIRTNKISEEVVSMNGKTNLYLPLPESEVQYNPNLNEYN